MEKVVKSREKLITDAYYKHGLSYEEVSKKLNETIAEVKEVIQIYKEETGGIINPLNISDEIN